jgi:hypothetical protein
MREFEYEFFFFIRSSPSFANKTWHRKSLGSLGSSPKITISSLSTNFPSSSFDFFWSVAVIVFGVRFSSSRPKDLPKTQNTTMKTQIFHVAMWSRVLITRGHMGKCRNYTWLKYSYFL